MNQKVRAGRSHARSLVTASLVLSLAGGLAGVAQAQLKPGSRQGLGLTGAGVPPLLAQIRADPYRVPAEPVCPAIAAELAQLDAILGPDVDKLKTNESIGDQVANRVRDMIPYRGVIRFLTQADARDHKLQTAATVGYARRGFLHGLSAQRHCDAPADLRVAPATAADAHAVDVDARAPVADARLVAISLSLPAPIAPPPPVAGERLAAAMVHGPEAAPPTRTHVVYQLVDSTSGRAIVPDEPDEDSSGGR